MGLCGQMEDKSFKNKGENNMGKKPIIIKGNTLHSVGGIVFIIMAIIGLNLLWDMDSCDSMSAYIFSIVWILIALIFSVCSFIEASKKVILCDTGVYFRSLISKDYLDWNEIKDWGLSYSGSARGGGEIFVLYFSKNVFRIKNARKKSLKGKMIKIEIFEAEYVKTLNNVIPYCKKKTFVDPFIGEAAIEPE